MISRALHCIYFSVLIQCASVFPAVLQGKIVGGSVADKGSFPHQVALIYNGKFLCGGSIIDKFLVLTAAHCVVSPKRPNIFDYEVIAGLHNKSALDGNEQIRHVKHIYSHPDYNSTTFFNDIAIIVLSKWLEFTPHISKLDLPETNEEFSGYATVSGWGQTHEKHKMLPDILKKVVIPIVPFKICRENYQKVGIAISDSAFCIGEFGHDSCQGDSGSAATCEKRDSTLVQCGIVSSGHGCGRKGFPGIYTKLSSYISWIQNKSQHMLKNEKREDIVIQEIQNCNITKAVETFKSFEDNLPLRGIILRSYDKKKGLQNFLDILEFIKKLPYCSQDKIAFPALYEVLIRNKDGNDAKTLFFDQALNQCMNTTELKKDIHSLALSFLKQWSSIVRLGKDTKVITEFAKQYVATFSAFIEILINEAYEGNVNSENREVILNILDFINKLPYCSQDKIAIPTLWNAIKKTTVEMKPYLLVLSRTIKTCMNATELDNEVRPMALTFAENWAYEIRSGGNLREIPGFARRYDVAFSGFIEDIIKMAYSGSIFNAEKVLEFINELPVKPAKILAYSTLFNEITNSNGFNGHEIVILAYRAKQLAKISDPALKNEVKKLDSIRSALPTGISALIHDPYVYIKSGQDPALCLGVLSNNVRLCPCSQPDFNTMWIVENVDNGRFFRFKIREDGQKYLTKRSDVEVAKRDGIPTAKQEWDVIPIENGKQFYFVSRHFDAVLAAGTSNCGSLETWKVGDFQFTNKRIWWSIS